MSPATGQAPKGALAATGAAGQKRQRWLIWITAGVEFVLGFESAGLQLALLRVVGEFELGPAMMGVLVSAQYFALLIVQPIFGVVADRLGKKRIVVCSLLVFILGCLLTASSNMALAFLIGIFITGSGYSLAESLCTAALADAFPDKSSQYMNLSQSLFCAGAVLSPLVCNWLFTSFGFTWRIAFILSAAGFALLFPFLLATPFGRAVPAQGAAKHKRPVTARAFLTLGFLTLVLSILLYGGVETTTGSFVDARFALGFDAPQLGVYSISLYWLAMMVSRIVFAIVKSDPRKVIFYATLGVAVAQLGLALSTASWLAMVWVGLIGFALGPPWAMLVSLAAAEYPQNSGTAVTLMSAGSGTGAAIIPLFAGAALDRFGVSSVFLLTACVAGAGALMFYGHLQLKKRAEARGAGGASKI